MIQIATDTSQSARLLDCGLDPKSADFVWMDDNPPRLTLRTEIIEDSNLYIMGYGWSLSALLRLLPTEIKEDNGYYDEIVTYGLLIYPYMQGWQIDYQCCVDDECYCLKCIHDTELIEACVRAIEYLSQNGYKLNMIN